MAQREGDCEKGEEMGSLATLELVYHTVRILLNTTLKINDNGVTG